ncbi:P-loop containing nucleoside triphosphate hydrolase protein [Chytriomyces cf. hyalinus JEL632]|nr:P-loop containing nucleoside triphosphate hydrolase protein [Chytriomyces cf. hyalinus JEL632]
MKSISIATTPTLNTPPNHASPSRTSNSPSIRARSPSPAGSATSSQAPVSNASIKPAPLPSVAKGKRINVVQEYAKRNLEKSSLNLVVVGHVDAGKSTLMGHLLYLLGEVNERTMKKYERDAEKMKKGSFCFAWVLDETEEERSRGVTIDVGMSYFETQLHRFTILDAPGHRDFVPNMISGASQADVALLVIDSGAGEFEVGFELGGQTREHALLVRSLGVGQLVVAVNKLDTIHWSESRFYEIKEKLTFFLLGAGFKKDKLTFVPCSGFTGENMIECKSQELLAWYEGPTLRECLDALQPPVRLLEKPFRLPVTDYFKGGSAAGGGGSLSVSGRIEAGTLQIGDAITVMPLGEHGAVKAIESNNEAIKWAVAGDNVVITLNGIDVQQISIGNVLCAPQSLVPVADAFQVKIVTFDIAIPLTLGVPIVLHHQSASTPGIISKLVSILNRASGEVIKKNPRALPKNVTAIVDIKLDKPICVELAKESRELGRVMIRSGSTVVAAGIVTEIVNRVK